MSPPDTAPTPFTVDRARPSSKHRYDGKYYRTEHYTFVYECPACHEHRVMLNSNYCCNCGARMIWNGEEPD
jgi:hypothetical protein